MQRVVLRPREQTGRNVSERRAGLETGDVEADPAKGWGRPKTRGYLGERVQPRPLFHRGNGDGMPAYGGPTQHGRPQAAGGVTPDRTPARDRPGCLGSRRGP